MWGRNGDIFSARISCGYPTLRRGRVLHDIAWADRDRADDFWPIGIRLWGRCAPFVRGRADRDGCNERWDGRWRCVSCSVERTYRWRGPWAHATNERGLRGYEQ